MKIPDAHCHLYKFEDFEIKNILKEFIVLSVSEDVSSSLKSIKLSYLYESVIPAVGIHPWNVSSISNKHLEAIKELVDKENVKVLGEVGLDKKFVPLTYEKQKEVFEFFLKLAKEYDLSLNLHTPNAWEEVYNLLIKYDVKKAYFHWYTGPINLLKEIEGSGYFVGINVAVDSQEKHKKVLEEVNLNYVLIESDAPYDYKGKIFHPFLIKNTLKLISSIKNISEKKVVDVIKRNFSKFLT